MTLTLDANTASAESDVPFLWERQIQPTVDSLLTSDAPPRVAIVGNAWSGKSATLQRLHALLAAQGRKATLATADRADLAAPAHHVLLTDDLHHADEATLARVAERAADPAAALVVALRPTEWSETTRTLLRSLEQSRPSVVLGHLSRSDVLHFLEQTGKQLSDPCLDRVLDLTGGMSWLTAAAITRHDERDCAHDPAHAELVRVLAEQVSHRLASVRPELRDAVESLCLLPPGGTLPTEAGLDDVAVAGYAAGLLSRNGQPLPIVRLAVHQTIPVQRLLQRSGVLAEALAHSVASADHTHLQWVGVLRDEQLGQTLTQHADRLLDTAPARASELYAAALESGVDPSTIVGRRAQALWSAGKFEEANVVIDSAPSQVSGEEARRLADTAAAIWATRGMLEQAYAVYEAQAEHPSAGYGAALAGFGIGITDRLTPADAVPTTTPTALAVSMQLLERGLAASISTDRGRPVLADLVRAAELYTSARASAPTPELPAVIAAVAALNLGSLSTARTIIDDALAGNHGGPWARARLLLWRAWIAMMRARPTQAREALAEAAELPAARSPRNALLAQAVHVGIARRYEDAAGLETAWRQARGSVLRVDVDMYLLHPLAELVSAAARAGDAERIHPQFQRALGIVERLGNPPMWAAHLRWAGIQQGILLNSPDALKPHAHALVEASAHSRVAKAMAHAGRVWTSVLGGTVDADAVESAAKTLASIGLIWDAARLAGHAAARSKDRRASTRLLACARELHPIDPKRVSAQTADDGSAQPTRAEELLSERELEVARLVLEGKTYAEIGETIFISPRTAEHHIAHIRRRLGVSTRSEMLATLRQMLQPDPMPSMGDDSAEPPSRSPYVSG